MQAITNSNSERIADATSTAGAPSQPTNNSCAQSSFGDCLEREQQSQAAASQPSQQGVVNPVNTSAIPQNASVIDYSLAPQGSQSAIQSSVQMAAMDLNSTLINLGIAKWASPNPNPDPMPTGQRQRQSRIEHHNRLPNQRQPPERAMRMLPLFPFSNQSRQLWRISLHSFPISRWFKCRLPWRQTRPV